MQKCKKLMLHYCVEFALCARRGNIKGAGCLSRSEEYIHALSESGGGGGERTSGKRHKASLV